MRCLFFLAWLLTSAAAEVVLHINLPEGMQAPAELLPEVYPQDHVFRYVPFDAEAWKGDGRARIKV